MQPTEVLCHSLRPSQHQSWCCCILPMQGASDGPSPDQSEIVILALQVLIAAMASTCLIPHVASCAKDLLDECPGRLSEQWNSALLMSCGNLCLACDIRHSFCLSCASAAHDHTFAVSAVERAVGHCYSNPTSAVLYHQHRQCACRQQQLAWLTLTASAIFADGADGPQNVVQSTCS